MGKLLAIAKRQAPGAPMFLTESATIEAGQGIEGESSHKEHRQVTVLSHESWQDARAAVGADVPWTMRRANLLIEGIDLQNTVGRRLQIGKATLEVTDETKPCGRMDEQHDGLREALEPAWRGGICCRVIEGGSVRVGDSVELLA